MLIALFLKICQTDELKWMLFSIFNCRIKLRGTYASDIIDNNPLFFNKHYSSPIRVLWTDPDCKSEVKNIDKEGTSSN